MLICSDPAPFRKLTNDANLACARRSAPSPTQQSPLSDLQKLVKRARTTIVDPVLSQIHIEPDSSSDEEDESPPDPRELKRQRDRDRIRELKRRKIGCGLTVRTTVRGDEAVFVRRDTGDESVEVDMSLDGEPSSARSQADEMGVAMPRPMMSRAPTTPSVQSDVSSPMVEPTIVRVRRPSKKLQDLELNVAHKGGRTKAKAAPIKVEPKPEPDEDSLESPSTGPNGKPRSETYKQAWSVSEQHLLERLLEEIPDGEKNRCVGLLSCSQTIADIVVQMAEDLKSHERSPNSTAGRQSRPKVFRET